MNIEKEAYTYEYIGKMQIKNLKWAEKSGSCL